MDRLGACFPVYASRHEGTHVPSWAFFIAKYFGSGIIIATAFIHVSLIPELILNMALCWTSCLRAQLNMLFPFFPPLGLRLGHD